MNTLELRVGVKSRLDLLGNMSKDKGTEADIVTTYILMMLLKCSYQSQLFLRCIVENKRKTSQQF